MPRAPASTSISLTGTKDLGFPKISVKSSKKLFAKRSPQKPHTYTPTTTLASASAHRSIGLVHKASISPCDAILRFRRDQKRALNYQAIACKNRKTEGPSKKRPIPPRSSFANPRKSASQSRGLANPALANETRRFDSQASSSAANRGILKILSSPASSVFAPDDPVEKIATTWLAGLNESVFNEGCDEPRKADSGKSFRKLCCDSISRLMVAASGSS